MVQKVKMHYAPDHRTAIFEVKPKPAPSGVVLNGKTDQPEAKKALLALLDQKKLGYVDSIMVLPDAKLDQHICGLIDISVANLRTAPEHDAELATQALLGTPVKILESEGGWYRVQTPDHYISWTDDGALTPLTSAQLDSMNKVKKIIFIQAYGFAYSKPDERSLPVSDLVMGCVLRYSQKTQGFYKVYYPDGRTGFVPADAAEDFDNWANKMAASPASLVNTAEHLTGLPYLWGGTSAKGVDCSGFTKTVYLMNGLVLPRDASQQNEVGTVVDSLHHFNVLEPGDLLFFGQKASSGSSERIVHVGMWIGNMQFIHSSGDVHISSMDSTQPDFDRYNYQRYIRAKRILDKQGILEKRSTARLYRTFPQN